MGHERGHPSALLPLGARLSGTDLRVASIGSKLSMLLACRQKNSRKIDKLFCTPITVIVNLIKINSHTTNDQR